MTLQTAPIAPTLGKSRHFPSLCSRYAAAPSAVLMRTPEAELLSALPMEEPVLDLCCGDGYFCSLLAPAGVAAGCDFSLSALRQARSRGQYGIIARADVARGIPFRDSAFRTVFSNSSLEHIVDVDRALREIQRLLQKGGRFYTTFASSFAYDWWPCSQEALARYLKFQPVHNYPPLEEWERRIEAAGLHVVSHRYYLSRGATRLTAFLDYHLSRVYITPDRTLARPIVRAMSLVGRGALARLWRAAFTGVRIDSGEFGGGLLIVAERIE